MYCFYHSKDLDGKCSGAIVKYKFPDCNMIGIDYGDKFDWNIVKGEKVIIVDYTPDDEIMQWLIDNTHLVWIDHHISTINKFEKYVIHGMRKNDVAACYLTWWYFFPFDPVPYSVRRLSDYDIWDHSNFYTLPYQYGMKIYDCDPENQYFWRQVFFDNTLFHNIADKGKDIWYYERKRAEEYVKKYGYEEKGSFLDGKEYNCLMLNTGFGSSTLFDSVYNEKKHDIMVCYINDGNKIHYSIYSKKDDIDCSEIAKLYNGGGHKQAAGFIINI